MSGSNGRAGRILVAVALMAAAGCGKAEGPEQTALTSVEQAATSGPDFVVSAVTGPTSATPDQQITASVKVCNQGSVSESARVEVYLSADKVITPASPGPSQDFLVGHTYTNNLWPGQCETWQVSGIAGVYTDGAFYLGAVVDPENSHLEANEANNTRADNRIGVGYRSDFVVSTVTGPASATPGQQITASVKVCNQGTDGDSALVELYLSTDTNIIVPAPSTPPYARDVIVSGGSTDYLMPGQCQVLSMAGAASPYTEGPFYLGAIVDPYGSRLELIEDNNARAGTRMGVGHRSDFVVSAVTGPVSAQQGQQITASVTVCNQGTQGDSTHVELYLSTDANIAVPLPSKPPDVQDVFVGGQHTDYLVPGQCQVLSVSGPASSYSTAPHYVGAIVDPQNSRLELIEDNNAKAGTRMGIGLRPDFIVSAVTGPASAEQGQLLTASVTVCNQGTQAGSTQVELYLSTDATIAVPVSSLPPYVQDALVSSAPTDHLVPGQCQVVSMTGSADPNPSPPGGNAYYLGAAVDPQTSRLELIEDNNTRAGNRIGVGTGADFVVSAVTGPVSAEHSQQITASVKVCNQGTQGGGTHVELYLSTDTTIVARVPSLPPYAQDVLVGGASTNYLSPGQCQVLPVSGSVSTYLDGPHYLGAVVDPQNSRTELIEDNNAKVGNRIGVGYWPDFVVSAVTGPASAQQGQQITASVTVCNQGTQAGHTWVELYLSKDATITPPTPSLPPYTQDVLVNGEATDYLVPGQCQALSISGPASTYLEGAHYLGAVADPQNSHQELIEDNNAKAGSRIGVGNRSDFVVSTVTGPASAQQGQQITASVKVCNQGTQADSTYVELYLSTDTTIAARVPSLPPYAQDVLVGGASTSYLVPGQCQVLSVSGPASTSSEGAHYLGAVVDPQDSRTELIEDNNAKAGSRIGVGYRPDFVVSAVTGPASAQQGQQITASVTVCNQGTQVGQTIVEMYLSSDATITPPTPSLPPHVQDVYVGGTASNNLAPGQCQTLPVTGVASPYTEGAFYLGAVADPYGNNVELIEDNNAKAGTRIGVGYQPDFVVSTVTGPASAQQGQQITVTVTVCNQGTRAASTGVEVYLSTDKVIAPPAPPMPPYLQDALVGGSGTNSLQPGQCQSISVSGPVSPYGPGPHYLGAVVDPQDSRTELIEDNNTQVKAGAPMSITP